MPGPTLDLLTGERDHPGDPPAIGPYARPPLARWAHGIPDLLETQAVEGGLGDGAVPSRR